MIIPYQWIRTNPFAIREYIKVTHKPYHTHYKGAMNDMNKKLYLTRRTNIYDKGNRKTCNDKNNGT